MLNCCISVIIMTAFRNTQDFQYTELLALPNAMLPMQQITCQLCFALLATYFCYSLLHTLLYLTQA